MLKDKLKGAFDNLPVFPSGMSLRPEILLHPNIPKPLHGVAPRVVLGRSWWDQTRKAAYKSTNYHCLACGVHKTRAKLRQWLEAHEIYEIDYGKGRAKFLEVVPLCHCCHNYIHDGRLRGLLEQGKLHHSKYVTIIQHGDLVLSQAGLARESLAVRDESIMNGKLAEWGSWRLRIGRNLYKPKFKSLEEWMEAHNGKEADDD